MSNPHPPKTDYIEKVKLRVGDLRKGMFVCELDRPWLETPFLFQGFELKTDADIEEVGRHCEHVYIDLRRTRPVQADPPAAPPHPSSAASQSRTLKREIEVAENTRQQTSNLVKSFIDEVRFGRSVDVLLAQGAVSECVASILRNPEAMLFVTQMRDRDEMISQNAFNACAYSIMLGHSAGLDAKALENLGTCGLLHDIGKVSVPERILNKPGRLSPEELDIMRQHTTLGRDILMSGRNTFSGTVDAAYGHHENLDGSGYPRGLQGHQLNLACKVVSIVEKYEAIVSPRPFRPAYIHLDAFRLLNRMAGGNLIDRELTNAFVSCLGIYPPGTVVELSNGEIAIVLQSNQRQRLRPQILVVRDASGADQAGRLVDMALKDTDELGRPYKIKSVHRPIDLGIDLQKYRPAILQSMG